MNKMVSLKAALLREKDFKSLEEVRARANAVGCYLGLS